MGLYKSYKAKRTSTSTNLRFVRRFVRRFNAFSLKRKQSTRFVFAAKLLNARTKLCFVLVLLKQNKHFEKVLTKPSVHSWSCKQDLPLAGNSGGFALFVHSEGW